MTDRAMLLALAKEKNLSHEDFLDETIKLAKKRLHECDAETRDPDEPNDPFYSGWERGVIDCGHILTTFIKDSFIIPR